MLVDLVVITNFPQDTEMPNIHQYQYHGRPKIKNTMEENVDKVKVEGISESNLFNKTAYN